MEEQIKKLVDDAQRILVIQADNPDADSLGSALALEHTLGDLGKDVGLYCGVDIPTYLRYLSGWDRVLTELPSAFDLSIIVDASTYSLFDQIEKANGFAALRKKPCVVLDHHANVERPIDFTTASIVDPTVASTGELIYHLAVTNGWSISKNAASSVMASILGDTQGLMNNLTQASTYRVMADLTELGADRPLIEELRREYSRMPESIYRFKGELISRTEFPADGRLALVTITQDEINEYSPLYNPAVLVQFDSLQVIGVMLSIVFKLYDDGHITGKLRSNMTAPIADKLAAHFGGGGHSHSAGFKITDGRSFTEIKNDCIQTTIELLNNLE